MLVNALENLWHCSTSDTILWMYDFTKICKLPGKQIENIAFSVVVFHVVGISSVSCTRLRQGPKVFMGT